MRSRTGRSPQLGQTGSGSRLFTAACEEIRYDPYQLSHDPHDDVASNVISRGVALCIPKAVVVTAAARSPGIPARVCVSDVKNHLQFKLDRAGAGDRAVGMSACDEDRIDGAGPRPANAGHPEPLLALDWVFDSVPREDVGDLSQLRKVA